MIQTNRKRLPNSIRRFIRTEKARIRRDVIDPLKKDELIKNLVARFVLVEKAVSK